ncbi:MAG: efflux RND transporter periplasmic adaptor subunit [Bacteroidales bacterium]|nr:efflux RND transporter periplasmic adaptor subunit [Bacteroidales bacterium]
MKQNDTKNDIFRKKVPVLLCAILSGFLLYSCNKNADKTIQQGPAKLKVTTVQRGDARSYIEYPALIEGEMDVEIRPLVEGYLEKICVDEGDYVRKGELLFKIEESVYRQQYNQAKANLAVCEANLTKARIEVDKSRELVENRVISEVQLHTVEAEYKSVQAAVTQAEAAVSNAKIQLGYTNITAPIDGFIGRFPFKTGSLISPSNTLSLTQITDIDNVRAYFSMSEADYVNFSEKYDIVNDTLPVTLVLVNGHEYEHGGKIDATSGMFEKNMGTISIRANFPNPKHKIRSGNTGKVRIPTTHQGVLQVPKTATFKTQDKTMVYYITPDSLVQTRVIHIAGILNDTYLIDKGLEEGDKILVSGLNLVTEGMKIQPVMN